MGTGIYLRPGQFLSRELIAVTETGTSLDQA
jgi:hypothetical protein